MASCSLLSRIATVVICLALVIPASVAQEATQSTDLATGSACITVKKQPNIPNTRRSGSDSPMSTQDLRVQVNCPSAPVPVQPVVDPDAGKNKSTDAHEETWWTGLGVVVKLTLLVFVLLAAGWMFFLAGRLLKPQQIADATQNFYVRKHWGGFGGESSGWHVSASLGACVSGLVLVILATSLVAGTLFVLHRYEGQDQNKDQATTQTTTGGSSTGGSASTATPVKPSPSASHQGGDSDGAKRL